jgi:hypothetical protein
MYTRHHAVVSALVGVALAVTVSTPLPAFLLVVGVTLLGVFVDLDHFLIARVRTGNWNALVRCLRSPRVAFLDQDEIFEGDAVGAWPRLGTHVVITAALVTALAVVSPALALAAGVVLVVHIGCDVAYDVRRGALP